MAEIKETSPAPTAKRGRGRPRKDSEFTSLSKDLLAEKALEIAGAEGYGALTMHRLASDLGVTPRALYDYVADRQEVVNLAVQRFLAISPLVEFDSSNWKQGVRQAYVATRTAYRAYPRASQMSWDDKVDVAPGPRRTELIERVLRFYVEIGLTLQQAVTMVRALERDVLGFVLHVDYFFDRREAGNSDSLSHLVSAQRLDAYPEISAPLARQALELPAPDSDELFEEVIETRILAIEQCLSKNRQSETDQA